VNVDDKQEKVNFGEGNFAHNEIAMLFINREVRLLNILFKCNRRTRNCFSHFAFVAWCTLQFL